MQEKVQKVQRVIYLTIKKYTDDIEVEICNFYRAIRASNSDFTLNFWIRIQPDRNDKLIVDFSSVELPKELRRKGIFTNVFKNLLELDDIKNIKVTSVITEEMKNWCTNNNFKVTNEVDYVYNKEDK